MPTSGCRKSDSKFYICQRGIMSRLLLETAYLRIRDEILRIIYTV